MEEIKKKKLKKSLNKKELGNIKGLKIVKEERLNLGQ